MPPSAQSRICHHAKLGSSWFNAVLVVSNAVDIVTMLLLVLVVIVVFGILLVLVVVDMKLVCTVVGQSAVVVRDD